MAYPLDKIRVSSKVPREGREEWRTALAENIAENGLINPLIVLNHRPDNEYKSHWLMTGTNRYWAVTHLGWEVVPAIVTGECEYGPKRLVSPQDIQNYFPDGEVYFGYHGPRLRNVCKPEEYDYPTRNTEARPLTVV